MNLNNKKPIIANKVIKHIIYTNDKYTSLIEELEGVEVPIKALPKRAN